MNRIKNRGYVDGGTAIVVGVILLVVALISLLFVWGAGTWSETNASSMTCVYNGGPLDDNSFTAYAEPAQGRTYQGMFSDAINVPVGIRQYRVSLDPNQGDTPEADSIDVRVKGYEMQFEPTANFTLNTNVEDGKPKACSFIEKHLRQFGATDFDAQGGNWQFGFLNERFRPVLNDVATRVLQTYTPGDLKFNINGARDKAAEQIGKDLKVFLDRQFGDDFFCDTTYTFNGGKEACGEALTVILPEPKLADPADEAQLSKPQRAKIDADNDIAAAQEAARKAKDVATAKQTEADSAKALADANEKIAAENARVLTAQATNDYAWCAYLSSLNQDCALVKAAQNNDYPDVVLGDGSQAAVTVAP